jgi:hypothetical protein
MIHVKLPPRLHRLDKASTDRVLDRALPQIREAFAKGTNIIISSPDAGTTGGRRKIREVLRHADLEPEIVSMLGWSTTYPGAEAPQEQPVAPRGGTEAASCQHPNGSTICGAPVPCPDHPEASVTQESPPSDPPEADANAVR